MKTGVELIADERQRQMDVEGWTQEHDDAHSSGEMAKAATCYANQAVFAVFSARRQPLMWPWSDEWWRPTTPIRDLTKAGALIAAEIDRLQRIEESTS